MTRLSGTMKAALLATACSAFFNAYAQAPAIAESTGGTFGPSTAVKTFDLAGKPVGRITGQADLPSTPFSTAVLFVGGSGARDRDERFGFSGTDRDMVFRDLAARMNKRGLAAVRYDRRGVTYQEGKILPKTDPVGPAEVISTITDLTQADDFRAVYDWTRSSTGLNAKCVIVFAHSEGAYHLAHAAEQGAPAPLLVIGMGAPMLPKASDFKWKAAGRILEALALLDKDEDGIVANSEVLAGWKTTSLAAYPSPAPFLSATGAWSKKEFADLGTLLDNAYERGRAEVLTHGDTEPFPTAAAPKSSYGWWKSWYTDDVVMAKRLANWTSPFSLHFGEIDSQVPPERHIPAANEHFPKQQLRVTIHPGRGHTLGGDVMYGPIDVTIADEIAAEAAEAAEGCE